MNKLSLFLCLTLITYIFSQTADLVEDQSITTGTNIEFKILVTPEAESTAVTISELSGKLEDTTTSSNKITFTCTSPAAFTTATNVTCTTSPSTAGTYKLSTDSWTFTATKPNADGTSTTSVTISAPGSTTMTVTAGGDAAGDGTLSAIKVNLKASQTVKTGSNVELKLSVTPTGAAIKVSAISGLKLVLSTNSSDSTDITCTIASAVTCSAGSATDFTCKATTISTEGTYKLDGTLSMTATLSDDSAISGVTPAFDATNTLTVSNTASTTTSTTTSNNSKYLNFSFCLFFILLFF